MTPKTSNDVTLLRELQATAAKIRAELATRIIGQQQVIDDLLACFFAQGHCLLIGVPGLAKTMLVQSLAQCLHCSFNRIQFTPDLMPADITGSEILYEDRAASVREFRFVKGPVFSNIVLADEINRTPPKTQSALLQAMQEKQVTSNGTTWPLPQPFYVLATQNPIEQEGTYPLPEAQLDRFMFSIIIAYPSHDEELLIARSTSAHQSAPMQQVAGVEQLMAYSDLVWRMPVTDALVQAAVAITRATRPHEALCPQEVRELITWGAGVRASQYLVLAAKSFAALDGRPTPDLNDLKRAAPLVLRHRIVRSFHAEVAGKSAADIIEPIVNQILGK